MFLTQRSLTTWAVTNLAAAATFTYFASWTWLETNLRSEEVARDGDILIWMVAAFPILAGAFVANGVWLGLIARARLREGLRWPVPFIVIVIATWIIALAVDRLRF